METTLTRIFLLNLLEKVSLPPVAEPIGSNITARFVTDVKLHATPDGRGMRSFSIVSPSSNSPAVAPSSRKSVYLLKLSSTPPSWK